VGGGYIACEFAGIFNGFGTKVTQFVRGAQILRGFDEEARGLLAESMRDAGSTSTRAPRSSAWSARRRHLGQVGHRARGGVRPGALRHRARAQHRRARARGGGRRLGRRGQVVVDDYSQTSVPSIFAVGDVTDRINLTPVAIREGHAFADTIFGGRKTPVDHDLVASAVFTQPELGSIGMTEEEAMEGERRIEVYCTSFRPMQHAFIGKPNACSSSSSWMPRTRKVLGVPYRRGRGRAN
jgi:glutathione reductase (NADPH)